MDPNSPEADAARVRLTDEREQRAALIAKLDDEHAQDGPIDALGGDAAADTTNDAAILGVRNDLIQQIEEIDAADAAEDAHVEACTGDQIRAALAPYVPHLRDIHPDGAVSRITWGVKNLCHLHDQENPVALEPGRTYTVSFKLNDTAYSVQPGHRLRVAVSTSYFPMVWPAPEATALTLMPGTSSLRLPLRKPRPLDAEVAFDPPREAPSGVVTPLAPGARRQTLSIDAESGLWSLEVVFDDGRQRIEEIDLEIASWRRELWTIHPDDPTSATGAIDYGFERKRGAWVTRHDARCTMKLTKEDYLLHADLDAFEGGERIFARSWNRTVLRDHT